MVVGRSKEWGTGQPLHDRLSPLDHDPGDFVLLEESEDHKRDVVGGVGRGRAGPDADSDHHRAEAALLLLSGRTVCVEAGGVDRRILDTVRLDDIADLGTDSTPNGVEWSVKDAMDRLDGNLAESAGGLGEWCGSQNGK